MSKKSNAQHLADVKQGLAEKYVSLARNCNSKPLRAKLFRRAEKYRQQAAQAARSAN